ncbi:hypothetical protein [Aquisphaera insulae]|uniref:hypothetical protein n=1 Tax=Aquisphaera insulae TaxID=2712864 RepID=UPI0013EA6482|nr:hypothetical protein [Aquisphaera insulae]
MGFPTGDNPEVVTALAEFIADPKPYPIGSDPALDLRSIAAELRLLPVWLDMGGCYGIRPCGAVASFAWDEEHEARTETDERIRNMVYHRAGLKFPALAVLSPRRPADAIVCESCGGTGRCLGLSADLAARIVCYCGGLGWLPPSRP